MAPKLVQKSYQKNKQLAGPIFTKWWPPFWHFGAKTVQNKPRWPPKALQDSSDCENKRFSKHGFRYVFYDFWNTRRPKRAPKTAKKPLKTAPGSLQEPLRKRLQFLIQCLAKNPPQCGPKGGPKIVQSMVQKIIKTFPRK